MIMSSPNKKGTLNYNFSGLTKIGSGSGDGSQVLDPFKDSGRLKIKLTILTSIRGGMTANNLRKTSKEKEVVTMAKSLIKTRKKCQRKDSEEESKKSPQCQVQ
ncbi:TFIIS [Lepeophtheirus salmonis]|uniref:TFIIS n=1 Tax=Lepeophtheirus salmonis TaxID=72036 RepID=A0A7R8HE71_LEPSM|nr:TFIIS [Lepeophtheirus salmonis]CAF3037013.1 TFIIS [Lepeophtheirus salmonis]